MPPGSEVRSFSRIQLFATPRTVAYQAPLSMGFSRPEYWSGVPFPSPGDLLDPGIEPGSPKFQADALTSEPPLEWGAISYPRGSSRPRDQTHVSGVCCIGRQVLYR